MYDPYAAPSASLSFASTGAGCFNAAPKKSYVVVSQIITIGRQPSLFEEG